MNIENLFVSAQKVHFLRRPLKNVSLLLLSNEQKHLRDVNPNMQGEFYYQSALKYCLLQNNVLIW